MLSSRNLLVRGLRLTLQRSGALFWTYAFNLAIALIFALPFSARLQSVLSHSLAGQDLNHGFDLGTLLFALFRLRDNTPTAGSTNYLGLPIYALVYFVMVPGTLFCYQASTPARLSTLLNAGLLHFWRFFRITLLTILVSGFILGPLYALQAAWSNHVDQSLTGYSALWHEFPGAILLTLVALFLRLYFDLVAAYTVQIGLQVRPNGKPERRVRRTLLPALRTLARHMVPACGSFLLLTLLGLGALALTLRSGLHTLAQTRAWPLILLLQLGLFLNLFTRFWQRGIETVLTLDNPIQPQVTAPFNIPAMPVDNVPASPVDNIPDPIPDPEPASPSLSGPDRGIYEGSLKSS